MKTKEEILSQYPSKRNPFIGESKHVMLVEDAMKAMDEYLSQFTSPIDTDKLREKFYNQITNDKNKIRPYYSGSPDEVFDWFIANLLPQPPTK